MDGSRKQDAIIAEVTRNTTPSSPTFLLLPAMVIGGRPDRPQQRARSRQPHRSVVNTFAGLSSYPKSIDMDLMYEASLHVLWASLFQNTWATDQLKFASTIQPFTLEEKYNGTTTYRRTTGCFVDSLQLSARLGDACRLTFGVKGMAEETASSAIASSTYTAIAGKKPFTPADFVLNTALGVSSPKVQSLDLSFTNNAGDLYGFGTNEPDDSSLGELEIRGTMTLRFTALAQYTAFVTASDTSLDITMGHTTAEKYQLILPNACAYNPDISDPGSTGPHNVTVEIIGKYSAADSTAAILNRAVA